MDVNLYKLRCSLAGHTQDVRSVAAAIFPPDSIVSGSRDVTTKIWVPNDLDVGFREGHVMTGHSNFVSCVCVVPPDDKYPQGLVVTGSNDNTLLAYTLESPQPVFRLTGHADTVCAVAAGKFGTLLSGSWDKTARVWLNQKCVMTLKGHEAAVWTVAIIPEGGFMLTGSADRLIKLWRAGQCERTFRGHDDCVRGLAVLSTNEFLSCSNDSSVRRWAVDGECIQVYYGHSNFVYSISILPNGRDFISSGEDRNLKVWENGDCVQTIPHPAQSVWSCCVLPNGDIVTGASDGAVRVFSRDPVRHADDAELAAYENEVSSSAIPAQIGDLKTDDMPGPEALYNPGKREGQVLTIKTKTGVEAHQWSASEGRWVKIGDVVGASGGTQATSGKQLYEGREYDYVFDVELTEGHPPLKLPYNITDDPWAVAHHWLQKNELSPLFLDQVANFIQDQTKGVTLGTANNSSISDPFTGGGRYVPGSSGGGDTGPRGSTDPFTGGSRHIPSSPAMPHGADPFTGSGSYRPGGSSVTSAPAVNNYFPKTSCVTFDQVNKSAVLGKLREFNRKVDEEQAVGEDKLSALEGLLTGQVPSPDQITLIKHMLKWPAGLVFPVLDLLRLVIRLEECAEHFCSGENAQYFLSLLLACADPEAPVPNQTLAVRIMCNCFLQTPGRQLMLTAKDTIMEAITKCTKTFNKNIHIAVATLLINYSVAADQSDSSIGIQCMLGVTELTQTPDPEASFRLLLCVGTLVSKAGPHVVSLTLDAGIQQFIQRCKQISEPKKLPECAGFVEDTIAKKS